MGIGESLLFATVMALMDEIKERDSNRNDMDPPVYDSDFKLGITFDNMQVKNKLIRMMEELVLKADEATGVSSDYDVELFITGLLNILIYECAKATDRDYETRSSIYDFALNYCGIERDFSFGVFLKNEKNVASTLEEISRVTLDIIFRASTVSGHQEISTEFVKLITELMVYMEDAISKQFVSVTFLKRPPVIVLDRIIAAMEREMHRMEEEDPSLKEEKIVNTDSNSSDIDYIDIASYYEDIGLGIAFDNINAKGNLIDLAQTLIDKADENTGTSNTLNVEVLITGLLNKLVYECAEAANTDYETKNYIYDFALGYCGVEKEITFEAFRENEDDISNTLEELSCIILDTIFLTASISGDDNTCSKFTNLLAKLMAYMEDAIHKQFVSISFNERLPVIASNKILPSMKKEIDRLEEEIYSPKEEISSPKEEKSNFQDNERISLLRDNAHTALEQENMNKAANYYNEILYYTPNDWEALFYKELCSVYGSSKYASRVPEDTERVFRVMQKVMPLVKEQSFIRIELFSNLSGMCSWLCKLSANYFSAIMNEAKMYPNDRDANTRKIKRVYCIMKMMFLSGDAIEKTFKEDFEICKNLCTICWDIAFKCYENCNMEAPNELYDYYLKLLKYNPDFRCPKPLVNSKNSSTSTGSCYVATAVYGSYDCPQVWTLRRYRDYSLAKSLFGRLFIHFYYATSPTLVSLFGHTKWFNTMFRKLLDKFINHLISKGFKDTPYVD